VSIKENSLAKAALSAMLAALVTIATVLVQIPNPATRGYFNLGDVMIFVSSLTFGPIIGGFAGGVGSFLGDVISGFANYAPFTLIIKGTEGLLAGIVSNRKSVKRDVAAVILGGTVMVAGYFLAEFFPLQYGWAALTEIPGNVSQVVVGAALGIPISNVIRKRLPEVLKPHRRAVVPIS